MDIQEELKKYLLETLSFDIKPEPLDGTVKLPPFLTDLYTFGKIVLFNRPYILAYPGAQKEYTPTTVEKHFTRIREITSTDVVYVTNSLAGWNRKRFIEKNLSFIIPGTQMYLPLLGVDLREYVRLPSKEVKNNQLSPKTQEIALYVLGNKEKNEWTGAELAKARSMSLMSVHRAFDELKGLGAHCVRMDGKRRIIAPTDDRRKGWELLQAFLKTPVTRIVIIPQEHLPPFAFSAGLAALSNHSDIAEPEIPEFAVKISTWNKYVKNTKVPTLPVAELGAVRVQLWRYEPRFRNDNNEADILSIILTLQSIDDQRVIQAIEQALKEVLC